MRFYFEPKPRYSPSTFSFVVTLLKGSQFKFYLILQQALCDKMLSFTRSETDNFHIRRDYTSDTPQVNCYMYNLDTFLNVSTTSSLFRSSVRKSKMIATISLYTHGKKVREHLVCYECKLWTNIFQLSKNVLAKLFY